MCSGLLTAILTSCGKSGFAPHLNREIAIASCEQTLCCLFIKRAGGILLPQTVHMSLLVFEVACLGSKCGCPKVIIRLQITIPTRKSPHTFILFLEDL